MREALHLFRSVAWIIPAVMMSGCFVFSDSDCAASEYCEDNVAVDWSGFSEHMGSCEWEEEDCSLTGRTCLEDVVGRGVGCYYPELDCPPDVSSYCDGALLIICDKIPGLAEEKIDCAAEDLGCATLSETTAQCAPTCEKEGISCDYNWGAAYSDCRNGFLFESTCPVNHICVTLDMNGIWQDNCVINRHKCGFDTDLSVAPFCDGNQLHDSCSADVDSDGVTECPGGCTEFLDELGQSWALCDTDS